MPPRTRRTTRQPEQTQAATPALDENATPDQPQPEQAQTPAAPDAEQDGVPTADANDLLSAIDAETPAQPRVACPECTPAGGLPATATAFACVHGSWDLT